MNIDDYLFSDSDDPLFTNEQHYNAPNMISQVLSSFRSLVINDNGSPSTSTPVKGVSDVNK